jgi:hypothetical protein
MTKKISKVIVYYDDGTFEEMNGTTPVVKPYVPPTPDFRPDTQKVQDWPMRIHPPTTFPQYQPARDAWPHPWKPNEICCGTSTGNAPEFNKYTITSTGNGNVDISRK